MTVNDNFEQEINQIRLAIHEKTKNMTPMELNEHYMKNTEAIIKEYGFKIVTLANEIAS